MMRRYDSYKDSGVEWIGKIPKEWKTPRLKHSITETFGGEVIDKSYWGEGPETLYTTSKKIHQSDYPNFNDKRRTTEKDLLLSRNGDGIVHVPNEGSIYTNVVQLVRIKQEVDRRFLWYSLTFQIKPLNSYSDGDFIVSLNKEQWFNLLTPLPPLSEQQQIVSFLDTKTSLIDSLIEKTQRKIELLKEKRTSIINEVVTKGLNPNVEMKDSGVEWIGEIPNGWELTKMKFEVEIFGRIGFRGYTTEDIVNEGEGVITISPSNIKNDEFNLENRTYLSWEKYHESPEIKIFKDDIILVKTGSTIGKTSIIPDGVPEMTINPQLVVLKNVKLFPKFLYYQTTCKFIKESFDIEQTGSTTPTISQEKINDFPLVKPPISEQHQIVEYLDEQTQKIDKTISIEEKRIELLKEYRQSLISEVVTGKLKVVE